MKRTTKVDVTASDDYDILSAIWILASNDDNPIITYQGIKYRLGLSGNCDIRALVRSRAELFRDGIPASRLAEWKQVLRTGKHLPSWIRDIEDKDLQRTTIETLTPDSAFRSQFRAERDAPRSPIEIIDWGLQHLDRLRKSVVEAREEKIKRWTSLWIPLLSLVVALSAVISGAYLQNTNNKTQVDLKKYEVTFATKRDAYSSFMRYVLSSFESAYKKDVDAMEENLDKLETEYYVIEPFLQGDTRNAIWDQYQQFAFLCRRLIEKMVDSDEKRTLFFDSYLSYKKNFREQLYTALFES